MTCVSSNQVYVKPYSLLFQAIANPSRFQILYRLYNKGPMNVTEISRELGMEQTRASHHLKCLSYCGLLFVKREGKMKVYSVNEETVAPIIKLAENHIEKFANNLQSCDALVR